ncbi:glyA [Lepeophtheirus salmonis]|uniref:Serine hydroxymethyltransferase n=2 Tax=Lepeophtheirus salmonis TaxID=72036 RepID=A0A7R8CD65_LEPSM|nr:glyA [Lepeophtheirus salmonis]CAF2778251.1 glyA [Lepeophtheirus salmonis]
MLIRHSSNRDRENLKHDEWTEMYDLIRKEKSRQTSGLEMIASENFTSLAVLECMGSCLNNKYSEGRPGKRYYGGNEFIDDIESLAESRSLKAFDLDPQEWGVNVQPLSGSSANLALYLGVVGHGGKIMGLDLPDGGHLTHGYFNKSRKVSATAEFFESCLYKVDKETGLIDLKDLEEKAVAFKPDLIIAGTSAYTRIIDYKEFRRIADKVGAHLHADMAHISGLVAAKVIPSPFPHCHFVTSTVHKTLRGPRAGVIFFRKDVQKNGESIKAETKVHQAVFPSLQGGPHNHAIAGVGVAMKLACTPEFASYQKSVVKNAIFLGKLLQEKGYSLVTDGTDNHMILVNLKPSGLTGSKGEKILELVGISVNKNSVPGDGMVASGIRLGTPTLTTRGLGEEDMVHVVNFIHEALTIAKEAKNNVGADLKTWNRELDENEAISSKIKDLNKRVETYASQFKMPGHSEL